MDKKGVLVELVGGAKGWVDEWVLAKGDSGATGFGQRDWVEQRGLGRGIGWSKGVWAEGLGGAKGFGQRDWVEQRGLGKHGGWRSKGVGEGAEEKRRVRAENKPASAPAGTA